jgi:hypothetical protein
MRYHSGMIRIVPGILVMVSLVSATAVTISTAIGSLGGPLLGFTRFEGTLLCLVAVVGSLVALSATATAYAVRSDLDFPDDTSGFSQRPHRKNRRK